MKIKHSIILLTLAGVSSLWLQAETITYQTDVVIEGDMLIRSNLVVGLVSGDGSGLTNLNSDDVHPLIGNITNSYVVVDGTLSNGVYSFDFMYSEHPSYSCLAYHAYWLLSVSGVNYTNSSHAYLPPYDGWMNNGTNVDVTVEWFSGQAARKLDKTGGVISGDLLIEGVLSGDGSGLINITPTQVGLGNVDNTPDMEKPVSYYQADVIALKQNASTAATDEELALVEDALLAQIEGIRTDFAGLNDHVGDINNPHLVTADQVGLANVDNTGDADKPVSTAQQVALDGKLDVAGGTISGDLTVQGALVASYIPPQGDLLMGSYTNGLPQ